MLLASAGVDDSALTPAQAAAANSIVRMCGALPLTLAVAASMVSLHPSDWAEVVPSLLSGDDRGELLESGADETGLSVEERIISASLQSLPASAERQQIEDLFHGLAIFPEDLQVPIQVTAVLCAFPPLCAVPAHPCARFPRQVMDALAPLFVGDGDSKRAPSATQKKSKMRKWAAAAPRSPVRPSRPLVRPSRSPLCALPAQVAAAAPIPLAAQGLAR